MIDRYPYTDFHELNLDWVIIKIEEVIEQNKSVLKELESVKEIEAYVKNYLENLDLYPLISVKIDSLVESGSFADIVQRAIAENHNINLEMILNAPHNSKKLSDPGNQKAYWAQGSCVTSKGIFVGLSTDNQGYCTIERYNIDTKVLELSRDLTEITHPNGMCYVESSDSLYIIDSEHLLLMVLSGTDLSTKSDAGIATQYQMRSIMYDDSTSKFYMMSGLSLYEWIPDTNSYNYLYTLPDKWRNLQGNTTYGIIQSGCINNGILYEVSNSPDEIVKFNLSDGTLIFEYPLDRYYSIYPVGEIESLSWYNNKLYICSLSGVSSRDQFKTTYIFETDLRFNNGLKKYNPTSNLFGTYQFYVDANNSNFNADGTSAKPFQTISQALQAVSSPAAITGANYQIRLMSDCDEYVYYRGGNLRIVGDTNTRSILGAQFEFCSEIELELLTFTGNYQYSALSQREFILQNAKANIINCMFIKPTDTGYTPGTAAIITDSNLWIENSSTLADFPIWVTRSILNGQRAVCTNAYYEDEGSVNDAILTVPSNSAGDTITIDLPGNVPHSLASGFFDHVEVKGYSSNAAATEYLSLFFNFTASGTNIDYNIACTGSLGTELRQYILTGTIGTNTITMSLNGWVNAAGSTTHTAFTSTVPRVITSVKLVAKRNDH